MTIFGSQAARIVAARAGRTAEAFAMLSAKLVLEMALEAAALLKRPEGVQWREIATHLKLPFPDRVPVSMMASGQTRKKEQLRPR